jgi:EmrB/QacA subfamily drug resistance transporter
LTCAVSFVSTLDISIVLLAFGDIRRSFHVSTASLSWVLTAYTIIAAALLVPSGRLTDRIGARRTFLSGIALFTLGSLLAGLAPGMWFLIAARVVQAVGSALQAPSSLAIISVYFRENRATAVGIWGATSGLGSALGPSVGAFITDSFGWRWVFLVNVPLGLAVVIVGLRSLRHIPGRDTAQQPDAIGSALIVFGVSAITLGLVQSEDWGWGAATIGSIALGTGLLSLLVSRCRRHPSPVIDLTLFGIPSFRQANIIAFVFPLAFFVQFFGLVQFFTEVWGDSSLRAGLRITPLSAIAAVVTFFAGRIADRYGHRAAMLPGTLCYAAGAAWLLLFLDAEPDPWRAWAPAAVLLGLGVGLTYACFNSAAVHALPADRYGAGGAMNLTINRTGGTFGVAVAVALLGVAPDASSYRALWWLMLVCALITAAVCTRLDTR